MYSAKVLLMFLYPENSCREKKNGILNYMHVSKGRVFASYLKLIFTP